MYADRSSLDRADAMWNRPFPCAKRANENEQRLSKETCPSEELVDFASKCCDGGISKCPPPDVCQDPTKFNPSVTPSWFHDCRWEQSPSDYLKDPKSCPTSCWFSQDDETVGCYCGDIVSQQHSLVSSQRECQDLLPGRRNRLSWSPSH